MAVLSSVYYYNVGKVAVAANGTVVTGAGTLWASVIKPGDTLEAAGRQARILDVVSDTSLTLALPWTGGALAAANYIIMHDAPARTEGGYVAESAREVIASARIIMAGVTTYAVEGVGTNAPPGAPITGDTYVAGAAPTGAWAGWAQHLMTWSGTAWAPTPPIQGMRAWVRSTGQTYERSATAWVLSDLSSRQPLDATLTALAGLPTAANKLPYFTGVDAAALADLTALGRSLLGAADQTALWAALGAELGSNANGSYLRLPNGYLRCWHSVSPDAAIATPAGSLYITDSLEWVYPAAFVTTPMVVVAGRRQNGMMASGGTAWVRSATSVTYGLWCTASQSASQTKTAELSAEGRWK